MSLKSGNTATLRLSHQGVITIDIKQSKNLAHTDVWDCYFDRRVTAVTDWLQDGTYFSKGMDDIAEGFGDKGITLKDLPCVATWRELLNTCYSRTYHQTHQRMAAYRMCDDWLDFRLFQKWYDAQDECGVVRMIDNRKREYKPEVCRITPLWEISREGRYV